MKSTETDVLIVGAGPAGSAAAIWLARAGVDVVIVDKTCFPRDKTCGDGLTPRAMTELRRIGLDAWARERIEIRGLRLRGFGAEHEIPWPAGRYGRSGSAIPRSELDTEILRVAAGSGARVYTGVDVQPAAIADTPAQRSELRLRPLKRTENRADDRAVGDLAGDVAGGTPSITDPGETLSGPVTIRARFVIAADGARSPLGRMLGRTWHRESVYATAARCYVRSEAHATPWIGSDLELRDADGQIQPGYGWIFPLGNGEVNAGVGALATAHRPAGVNVRELLGHYVPQMRQEWQLSGEPRAITSALLPMGGAVSGVAGSNWALTGDAAALINPLNGEGIDYALEAGRHLAQLIAAELRMPSSEGLSRAWPALLRQEFGPSFALARRLAALLTYPQFLPRVGPLGMASDTLMTAAVRCMGNIVTADDADLVSALWRHAGGLTRALEVSGKRPLFS